MSQWVERIRSHRIWGLLKSIESEIDRAQERESITSEAIDALDRLKAVTTFCEKRLAATDPLLVNPAVPEILANHLAQIQANVTGFLANGDPALLDAANGSADNVLGQLGLILSAEANEDLTAISQAAANYRTTLEKHLKATLEAYNVIAARAAAFEANLTTLEATIAAEQQRLAAILIDQQSQFSTAQDKRATDFSAAQNDQLTKFTTAFAELQTQFSTAQNSRDTAFSEFQRISADKVALLLSDASVQLSNHDQHYLELLTVNSKTYEERLGELQKQYAGKAAEILGQIEKNKKDVEDLVGVIGNLGVTSGYQKTANSAKWMMYFWQFLTSLSLVGLISVAILTAFPSLSEKIFGLEFGHQAQMSINTQMDKPPKASKVEDSAALSTRSESAAGMAFYQGLATRIFLALTFGIFAGYAGRQASHFMEVERKNRKLALELEALGPFIEPLGLEERSKFRIQVGERSFGVPENSSDKSRGDDPVSAIDLFKSKEIREFLIDLYDKSKGKSSA